MFFWRSRNRGEDLEVSSPVSLEERFFATCTKGSVKEISKLLKNEKGLDAEAMNAQYRVSYYCVTIFIPFLKTIT